MDVFSSALIKVSRARFSGRENLFKSRLDLSSFCKVQYLGRDERGAVRDAAANVSLEEPPIESEGLVEPREPGIGLLGESATPQVVGFSLSHRSRATLTSHQSVMPFA